MGKSEDKKELTKEVEMNEHTDTIPQVEAQEISFKFFQNVVLDKLTNIKYFLPMPHSWETTRENGQFWNF